MGSTPAYAGEPAGRSGCSRSWWVTPAYAGDPSFGLFVAALARNDPLLHGGAISAGDSGVTTKGRPPPTPGEADNCFGLLFLTSGRPPPTRGSQALANSVATLGLVDPPPTRGSHAARRRRRLREASTPPPTRSYEVGAVRRSMPLRSTPAYAGDQTDTDPQLRSRGLDPRLRGEPQLVWEQNLYSSSPPPLGEPTRGSSRRIRRGSTPAYAGEPAKRDPSPSCDTGRPPPTRGSRCPHVLIRLRVGSTPAYAGEPAGWAASSPYTRVDPRLRGGAILALGYKGWRRGRPPPTRGSQLREGGDPPARGSTPAYAGEPTSDTPWRRPGGVDPRLRGGAGAGPRPTYLARGRPPPTRGSLCPSSGWAGRGGRPPPTRGSHRLGPVRPDRAGSTPPTRGSPNSERAAPRRGGVDPRLRGEPSARPHAGVIARGSTPAYAGEPSPRRWRWRSSWVDPRLRGGASGAPGDMPAGKGRPPPTRGSPERAPFGRRPWGSTPAYAGEPGPGAIRACRPRVDPRLRGGAFMADLNAASLMGRPPPTRGSRARRIKSVPPRGSTPAYAGEPVPARSPSGDARVDPRLRGGAPTGYDALVTLVGRPPPTRGSRAQCDARHPGDGSTPAYAGEPSRSTRACSPRWVDPRLRGGAMRLAAGPVLSLGRPPPTRGSQSACAR